MKKSKGSVVIVEDDMLLSLVETRIIEKLGYKVIGKAMSGEEAITMAKELNPDVFVMDVGLKGDLNGIEACAQIRKFTDTPVIFLSGNSDQHSIKSAKSVGYADYLVKPIRADDILIPLKKAVARKNMDGDKHLSQAS
ncbi:response regulator [Rhodohalobacter barkolensis]|uniref:Response regulator n=1 Tax=Rhodohalobacter barkolensis TaxID=2053187 RepID=A0A2N0VE83_9BACT|nr:response regulator [Rhodohalobacter barkolensis]PKD42499.1 response regulator [Rhodohalobacter barkolensis]